MGTGRRKIFFWGMVAVVTGLASFVAWQRYDGYSEYRAYKNLEENYVRAMTEDTYGGKTPRETLDLFVATLKSGDVNSASKYFMLDDNLSRDKWVGRLEELKEDRFLSQVAEDLSRDVREDPTGITGEDDFKFTAHTPDGNVGTIIDMYFNKYSKIWKIESF